jgi:predicted PurR-regulated permease PerM
MTKTKHFSWQEILASLGAIVALVALIWWLAPYISVFFIALLAAYVFNPVVLFFMRKIKLKKRGLSIAASLISLCLFGVLLVKLVVPNIQHEIQQAKTLVTNFSEKQTLPTWIPSSLEEFTKKALNEPSIKKMVNNADLGTYMKDAGIFILNGLTNFGGWLLSLFNIFSFLLYFVFILIYYDDFAIEKWAKLIPKKWRGFVVKVLLDVEKEMKGYFRAQSKIVFFVSILFAIGFKLISLPLGIGLGVFVGLLNFVPYMQLLGLIPAVILALIYSIESQTNIWTMLLLVGIVFAVVQLIQEIWITPKVMGDFSGMNPALILLSLSVWGGIMGVIGMMLALPLTSLLLAYYRNMVNNDLFNKIE